MKVNKYNSKDSFSRKNILVDVTNLTLFYRTKKSEKLIINSASFKVRKGEILGIIGESGSGKSVITSTLTGLNADIQIVKKGKILIKGKDVSKFKPNDWEEAKIRGKIVSQVFQNPLSSLNPYKKIGSQIIESILINDENKISKKEAHLKAVSLLESVKIDNAIEIMKMYPHQMSGGMNQRIVIVIILAAEPELIIFDEPTTALDPVAQAQVIEIIREINEKTHIGMILISHDIALVSTIANTIAIMYAGTIIEIGKTEEIVNIPLHPYTWSLIRSIPEISSGKNLYTIPGQVPSDISKINGDPFAPRSEYALKIDFVQKPPVFEISNTHKVWSWLYHKDAPNFEPPKLILKKWKNYLYNKKEDE